MCSSLTLKPKGSNATSAGISGAVQAIILLHQVLASLPGFAKCLEPAQSALLQAAHANMNHPAFEEVRTGKK
jgi:hypothetical protein